jgi:hypothetical protein
MAAADAAPGGGLLWAEAGKGAGASMKAMPIETKIVLRIVISPLDFLGRRRLPIPFIRSSSGPAH